MISSHPLSTRVTAFAGDRLIAAGPLRSVALTARQALEAEPGAPLLIFDDAEQRQVEIDLRGSMAELVQRLAAADTGREAAAAVIRGKPGAVATAAGDGEGDEAPRRGRGRPKLGVVAREVTLLPRHWTWLNAQPGGASVALRKLVEAARRGNGDGDRKRAGQEAAYRFMHAIAGDQPGFEAAARALFAGDLGKLEDAIADWPHDIREHATMLAARALRD
ncbi:MAG TPA: DUF2239 family protein [Luteimonas sp.]|jgi:hypothetical protein|nr:DUF2239 family protein [Luteimonas sp.]